MNSPIYQQKNLSYESSQKISKGGNLFGDPENIPRVRNESPFVFLKFFFHVNISYKRNLFRIVLVRGKFLGLDFHLNEYLGKANETF